MMGSIDEAILAHRAWVARFQRALAGVNTESFDLAKARDDRACVLGKWLTSDSSESVLSPDLRNSITTLHAAFHETAGEMAARLNRQDSTGATRDYMTEFDKLSKQLVQLLLVAKKKL